MMLSVMVVGAGAAFSDQSAIKNTEAVDACTALNIIGGYPDGSFKPEGNITRAEVTKMICVALNGGKEPAVSTNTTPTFSDVRGTSAAWAEGYIESCAAQGIVSGVGAGKFAPAGNVTGVQLAKMLLVALGYNSDNEGFTGNAWATNVNVRAAQKGLYEGLEKMDTNAAITRDNAAQMVWNALNAYEVEYKTTLVTDANGQLTSQVTVQDKVGSDNRSKITLLEDKYEAVTEKGILSAVNYDDNDKTYTTQVAGVTDGQNGIGNIDATVDYSSLMGQQVKVMYTVDNKSKDVTLLGIYATDKNKTVTALYDDAKITTDNGKVTATINSKDYDITGITTIATNGTVIKAADYDNWENYPYAQVTLVDNNNDKVYEYAVVNPFKVAKLTSLTAKKAYFENALDDTDTYSMDLDDLDSYDKMAEDDYVMLTENTYSVSGNYVAVKATSVSGKVAGTKNDGSIKVDGTWYKAAPGVESADYPSSGDNLKYAIVANGFYFTTDSKNGSIDKLALVLKVGDPDFDGDYSDVKLLLSDGTTKVTKAYVKDGSNKNPPVVKTLYTYTTNNTGYVLEAIADGDDIGLKADEDIISASEDQKTYDPVTNKVDSKRLAADAKVFVLYEKDGNDAYKGKVVTGAAADKWSTGDYNVTVAYADGTVKVMVVDQDSSTNPSISDDSLYGVILSDPYTDKNADDEDIVVIDKFLTSSGIVTDLKIDADEFDINDSDLVKNALVSYQMDGSDYVEFAAAPDDATAVIGAVTDVDGNYVTVLTADGDELDLKVDKDDTTILYVDTDAEDAASGSIKKATKKNDEQYYANIMVIYKTVAEDDETNIIWGAAVDTANQLQDNDGNDILIDIE